MHNKSVIERSKSKERSVIKSAVKLWAHCIYLDYCLYSAWSFVEKIAQIFTKMSLEGGVVTLQKFKGGFVTFKGGQGTVSYICSNYRLGLSRQQNLSSIHQAAKMAFCSPEADNQSFVLEE